nr:hypothetical protein [Allomuricauda sp.]
MTREALRWFSISDGDLWLLTDSEVDFYNLIFAFIAVIFGQSSCLVYWFDRPEKVFNLRTGRLRSIVHEQRFFNWYFLAWFSKVATMYGLLFGMASFGGFYMIRMYPNFKYLFILIVIVLFLQVWNTLLLTYRRRAFVWMIISAIIVSALSFGLSRINLVNYKALNEQVISRRLDVQYHLRLPTAAGYKQASFRYRHQPVVSVVTPKERTDRVESILLLGKEECTLAELTREIKKLKSLLPQELQIGMPVFLQVDKQVPMAFVHKVAKHLALADIHNLSFLVIPADAVHDSQYYITYDRTHLAILNQSHFLFDYEVNLKKKETYANQIEIQVSKQGYRMNSSQVPKEELASVLRSLLEHNLDYAIAIKLSDELTFETYFTAISAIHEAVLYLRNKESVEVYGLSFRELEESFLTDSQKAVLNKYPLRYIEIWEGEENLFEYHVRPDRSSPNSETDKSK